MIDFSRYCSASGVDYGQASRALYAFYAEIDARNLCNTQKLELPCREGCAACCHESVFLTPLEFMVAWDFFQNNESEEAHNRTVARWLEIYEEHQGLIMEIAHAANAEASVRLALARRLRFRCAFLGERDECRIYPARELTARLFGQSFNADGGVYGCELVGRHLRDRTVTLLSAEKVSRYLQKLPFTRKRQVFPYYVRVLFG